MLSFMAVRFLSLFQNSCSCDVIISDLMVLKSSKRYYLVLFFCKSIDLSEVYHGFFSFSIRIFSEFEGIITDFRVRISDSLRNFRLFADFGGNIICTETN